MDPVVESRVHLFGHGIEQVRGPHQGFDVAVQIAEQHDGALGGDDLRSTREVAVFHVPLHNVNAVLVRESYPCRFIKGHRIP